MNLNDLRLVCGEYNKCKRCTISQHIQHHVHYQIEPSNADKNGECNILFIGEAPGVVEDFRGYPFAGRSGELLRKTIKSVYIEPLVYGFMNLVACRPCDGKNGLNRAPSSEEIFNCSGRRDRLIAVLDPEIIVLVGKTAVKNIQQEKLESVRLFIEIPHPAYLLRTGGIASKAYSLFKREVQYAFIMGSRFMKESGR